MALTGLLAGGYVSGRSIFVWPNLQNVLSTGGMFLAGAHWFGLSYIIDCQQGGYVSDRNTFVWPNLQNLLSTEGYV